MSAPDEEYLNWDRKSRISLPSKDADEYMLIPVREFQRLRKRIDEAQLSGHESIPAAYSALFGAALATSVAIPPLLTANGLPSWIIPTFIVSAAAFLVLGLTLVLIARMLSKRQKGAASGIAQDMQDIEATYSGRNPAARIMQHRPGGAPESCLCVAEHASAQTVTCAPRAVLPRR
jgi:hypothetical protein